MPRTWGRLSAGLVAAVAALGLAACGSSDSSTTDTSSTPASTTAASTTAGDSAAVAAAKALFAKYTQSQPQPAVPALPSKPKSGLTLAIVTCGLPVCATTSKAQQASAEKLGWKVKYVTFDLTPEAYKAAIGQVVQDPPDLVAINALLPDSAIAGQLTALQKAGTQIIETVPAASDPRPEGPVKGVVASTPQFAQTGELMGSAVVADAGGPAKTVLVLDPALAGSLGAVTESFSKIVTGAKGSVDQLKVSTAETGKAMPGQIVSYLQAHPDTKYVALTLADYAAGVPQALKSAGLSDKVKIISRAPQASTMADIKSGVQWASVGEENTAAGWRANDLLARLDANVDPGDLRDAAGWHQIFTADNTTDTSTAPQATDFEGVFEKAWHLN
jgi:Periplasmic binding protein domain